ncbi:MAG: hypothetical protein HC769_29000 [Cyanobacteria bacterium CRU_2_1]|nr:hypothetical protein [Cyanobacteria bacterium CRU_2_1]
MVSDQYPCESDYMRLLERFPLYSERGWNPNYLDDRTIGYFGDPDNGESGLRSMGNYIFTTCLLASDESYDANISGINQETLLDRAQCCLNYMVRSHCTGDLSCGNGGKWGLNWQSSWWTTKMALGAQLIWDSLSSEQQAAVKRVVVAEASHHLDRIVPSGLAEDTKAEENAWDAEILATAIALFPDHEWCDRWREKLIEFSFNTLSAPQDRESEAIVEGRVLKDQVYTVNIHSDYTIENHGACHFCYVASPLVSIAWSYYALISRQQAVPESLFHHVNDLWNQVKPTFLENRFAYIGGKDWARYTYGLYFIVPALVLLQHQYGDTDARTIEMARVKTLLAEQNDNGDGSFYGKRVTHSIMRGQPAKYETDCYADLGLAYLLHKHLNTHKQATPPEEFIQHLCGRSISQESGTCYVRTPKLFASFSWHTLTEFHPIALFIPDGMDDAAEWAANNLLGKVRVMGAKTGVAIRMMKATGKGFTVNGILSYRSRRQEAFVHQIAYEVIPERNLAIVESKFTARSKILVMEREGLSLAVANDRFNGYNRQFKWENGSVTIGFDPTHQTNPRQEKGLLDRIKRKATKLLDLEIVNQPLGWRWVNIDEKFGIVQLLPNDEPFNVRQEPGRNTPNSCLHYEILSNPKRNRYPYIGKPGDVLLHTKFLLVAGTSTETKALDQEFLSKPQA